MRVGDYRADAVSKWVGEWFDGELHAKRIASLSDGVFGVLNSASLGVTAIGLALAQAHGLDAKHATKQVDRLLSNPGIDPGVTVTVHSITLMKCTVTVTPGKRGRKKREAA
jgi:hypothetical protein